MLTALPEEYFAPFKDEMKDGAWFVPMKGLGYGRDYAYPHADADKAAGQQYLPDALKGRRFNWPGLETLYLSLDFNTVFREVSGGFAHRLTPYVLCSYDVDCEDIADLGTDAIVVLTGVTYAFVRA